MLQNYAIPMDESYQRNDQSKKKSFFSTFVNTLLTINQVNKKNKELASVIENQKRIISILAHDLRNPLTSIKSILDLKKSDIIDKNEEERMMGMLSGQLTSTLEMVDNVVNWGQLYLSAGELNLGYVNLKPLVDRVFGYETLQSNIKNNKLVNGIDDNIFIYTDARVLEFILRNLIDNANKFTENGTISVHLESGEKATLKIADTGVGMEPEKIKKLFTTASRSTPGTKNEKGSGLGLLLVTEFIERLHGTLGIESAVNEGTCFSISI